MTPASKIGRDAPLERHETQLVEPSGGGCQQPVVGDVGEGRAPPKGKRFSEECCRLLRPPSIEELGSVRCELLEAMEIERIVIHAHHVPRFLGLDSVTAELLAEV